MNKLTTTELILLISLIANVAFVAILLNMCVRNLSGLPL